MGSSVGRAKDWKSLWRQFKTDSKYKDYFKMQHYLYNMIANIKNGQSAKRKFVWQTREKKCEALLNILWNEGFIVGYQIDLIQKNKLRIYLKYSDNKPAINAIHCLSKPGRRIYYSINKIWKLTSIRSFIVFSTHKGLKSIIECKKLKIGGEPLIVIN